MRLRQGPSAIAAAEDGRRFYKKETSLREYNAGSHSYQESETIREAMSVFHDGVRSHECLFLARTRAGCPRAPNDHAKRTDSGPTEQAECSSQGGSGSDRTL